MEKLGLEQKVERGIMFGIIVLKMMRFMIRQNRIDGWRDGTDEIWSNKAKEFDECANWIKVEKAILENKTKEAWDKIPIKPKKGLTYEEIYGEVDALQKEMEEKVTHWMNFIVKNREIFN
jgi:hypothetical protein